MARLDSGLRLTHEGDQRATFPHYFRNPRHEQDWTPTIKTRLPCSTTEPIKHFILELTPRVNPNTLDPLGKARQSELLQWAQKTRLLKRTKPRKRTFYERHSGLSVTPWSGSVTA